MIQFLSHFIMHKFEICSSLVSITVWKNSELFGYSYLSPCMFGLIECELLTAQETLQHICEVNALEALGHM